MGLLKAEKKLRPLPVRLVDGGKKVGVVGIPDGRAAFIAEYNRRAKAAGRTVRAAV